MAFKRTAIPFFELANAAYASSTVTFFAVDPTTNARLTTLVTLYAGITGTTTVPNPYQLDSDGKFSSAVYGEDRFIAVVTDVAGIQQSTGIWEPALSNADVAAAAASAAAAALSETQAAAGATSASISAVAAAASAALALSLVGSISVTTTDTTPANLNTKLTVSAPLTKTIVNPAGAATANLGVTIASAAQVLAKASNLVILTPASLSFLNGDEVTTGLVRFATAAEATTGTVTTAAMTPAGSSAAITAATGNTVTAVNAFAGSFTNVSSGATVQSVELNRYRMTGTTACTTKLPTFSAAGKFVIVEFACTTGAIMTVGRNAQTIDGTSADDTSTRYGDIILYEATAVGTVRSIYQGTLSVS